MAAISGSIHAAHPQWTQQQLREAVGYEERYAYLLHDHDATELDESIRRPAAARVKEPDAVPRRS